MKTLIYLSFIFLLSINPLFALNHHEIDSLKHVLETGNNKAKIYNEISNLYKSESKLELTKCYADSAFALASLQKDTLEKGMALLNIGDYFFYISQYDSSLSFFQKSLNLFKSINNYPNIASVYSNIGTIYYYKGEYEKAIEFFKNAAEFQKLDENPSETAVIYNNVAAVYYYLDKYAEAIEYYEKSLGIKKEHKNDKGVANSLNNIANVYDLIGDYDKSIKFYFEAIKYCDKANDKALKSTILNNIASVYKVWQQYDKALDLYDQSLQIKRELKNLSGEANVLNNIGLIYKLKSNFEQAEKKFNEANEIFKKIGDNYGLAIAQNNLGSISEYKKDYKTAINFYYQSAILSDSINSPKGMAKAYLNLSRVYLLIGNISKTQLYLDKCDKISQQNNLAYLNLDLYKLLSELYERKGETKKALLYYKKYSAIKDSTFTEEKHKVINEINTKYETEKKEKQIIQQNAQLDRMTLEMARARAEQERKESQRNMIIMAFVLVLIAGFFGFRSYKHKKEANIILTEQKLLRSQMNPHFISNALASIQQFILANKAVEGARYLAKFTALMRNIIDSSRNDFVSVETELVTLESYLSLQQLRFKDLFDYDISVDDDIEQEETLVPPMLLQPIIENSIKHAFDGINYKGHISIKFSQTDRHLKVQLKDNGIGFGKSPKKLENHISYATSIIKERIDNLNKQQRKGFNYTIDSRDKIDEQSGTIVIFKLPLMYS